MRVVVRAQDAVGFNVALYEGRAVQNRDRKSGDSSLEAEPLSEVERLGASAGRLGSGDKPRGSDRRDRFALLLQLRCGLLEGSKFVPLGWQDNQDAALGKPVGNLLVLALEGQQIARNKRHIIQLHASAP